MTDNIYVTKPSLPPLEEYVAEISDIWETGIMTHQGPKHQKLQAELNQFLHMDHVALFANGHLALELGLSAMGIQGEVITTPFTFASTTQAILRNGCTPVFCDIKDDDFTMDPAKIEALITERTTAILPVHVYGNICDYKKIQEIADRHHLKVIYDAAHAFGETHDGINAAELGDASMFSFHATKVFNTVEGGCFCYHDASITQHLEGLRQFGQIVGTDHTPYTGSNAKLTEVHAAMGLCNLRHFSEYIEKRKQVTEQYRSRLSGIPGIRLSSVDPKTVSNHAYFPIVIEEAETGIDREMVIQALKQEHIFVRKYFWPLCSDFEVIHDMGIQADVPIARHVSDRVITLPCYSDLSSEDTSRICDIICGLYEHRSAEV